MSASRASRSPQNSGGVRVVTERDREIIGTVALYGAASRSQLMELSHFSSVSRANRRLRLLCEAKYLRRTFVATGLHQNETIYILGSAGAAIAAEDWNLELTEVKRQAWRSPERMYLEHHLLVLSVRLEARKVSGIVRLTDFLAEPECRHEYLVLDGSRKGRVLIKPDALAVFEREGEPSPVFIELDRGHVSLPQMSGVFKRYGHYWSDKAFQSAYGLAAKFTVAVITTAGHRRIDHLKDLAKGSTVPITLTTITELRDQGFLGPVWQCAGTRGPSGLWTREAQGGGP